MRRSRNPFLRSMFPLLPGIFVALSGGASSAAVLDGYCQYPPYVIQSVLPSVTLLVSNSQSMGKFAYGDPINDCATEATACGAAVAGRFDPARRYYGIFDSDSFYTNAGSNSGTRFSLHGKKTAVSKGNNDWDGNFLNWLTTRRIDVMKKVLTGGDGTSTEACGVVTEKYKVFSDDQTYTPFNADNGVASLSIASNCNGNGRTVIDYPASGGGSRKYQVEITSPGTTSGIIQEMTPKASLGLAFYNEGDGEGSKLDPQVDGSSIPISAYRNRIETPSRFNGMTVGAPLGEALWTITGQYARIGASSPSGPRYHNGDYVPTKDPYTFHGNPSRCVKGSVIIISDGEPCNDGNLAYAGVDIENYADGTPFDCRDSICLGPPAGYSPADGDTTIPACSVPGTNVGGLEDVALFAHTRDLRSSTFGASALDGRQNLDIYVIRAFGSDSSNLLKYASINGSFDDANGNGIPDPGEYATPGTTGSAYFLADDGAAIERALREIFENILKRATSGTAASVLASGEGSGANLVQAVFYPRRRFFDEVIEWTGTLQNLWYYVDPFFAGASIREDSDKTAAADYTPKLHLVTDNTIVYYFDQASQTTKANRYQNDSSGQATTTFDVIPFEEVKSIWEAGNFLHASSPSNRRIFTVIDNVLPFAVNNFNDNNASTLRSYLGAVDDGEAARIIRYIRGEDDASVYRSRTVAFPTNTSTDNTVWKLGDVVNSTPKIASRVPPNTYDRTYLDRTYKDFTSLPSYRERGMVFVGGNDGMLHAFKLGKLEFPGDNNWTSFTVSDKARLRNLEETVPLGAERWAFVPKNALPYLRALADNNYCHLYYVDLSPQLFDASIGGADNAVRDKDSWRTILIGGMRFGGACRDYAAGVANVKCDSAKTDNNCVASPVPGVGFSSYFAIDVTNPESPTVLWEFSDPSLGFATTGPAVVRINERNSSGNPDRRLNGKWFVVFGSGPTGPVSGRQFLGRSDQNLRLFVVDLKTGALLRTVSQFASSGILTISNAFAGSLANSTADFDLDYQDDAVYLGYVQKNTDTEWNRGGVVRLQTNGDRDPANWTAGKVIQGIGPVTSSVVRLQNNTFHTNWLFFGTGRYYFASATALDDASSGRRLYGVKDPCFSSENNILPACTRPPVDPNALQDVTLDTTTIDEATANASLLPGWRIDLDTDPTVDYDGTGVKNYQAERVITDPLATISGTVFFTTFRPYGDDCAIGGRTFLWGVRYNTGVAPAYALQGRALMQVSTASIEQLDLKDAFTKSVTGADSSLHRGGRRSYGLEGVPPTAQGLSILSQPPALKRILHMKEK